MTWVAVATIGAGLVTGYMTNKQGQKQQQQAGENTEADRRFAQEMYREQLGDQRADQYSDYGSLKWTQDPQTGKWTQRTEMNPAEQARLGDWRQIAADRMGAAKGISSQFAQGGINYDALGMGKIASAAGVQGGGNSDAIGAARQGQGIVGMPSMNRFQQGALPPSGGGMMMRPPPQMQGPPPGPQGPGAAGGQQRVPYTPTPITPPGQPPPPAPPPTVAAPPPAPAAPTGPPGMDLNNYLNSGMKGVDDDTYYNIGGGSLLEQARKIDPNARWRTGDIGSGGDDPHAQQGRMLNIDPALLAASLRKQP